MVVVMLVGCGRIGFDGLEPEDSTSSSDPMTLELIAGRTR